LWMRLSARSKVVDAGGWTPTAVGVIEAHGWQRLLAAEGDNGCAGAELLFYDDLIETTSSWGRCQLLHWWEGSSCNATLCCSFKQMLQEDAVHDWDHGGCAGMWTSRCCWRIRCHRWLGEKSELIYLLLS
jgi:hypothetical protein